jgi:hypothetical protein
VDPLREISPVDRTVPAVELTRLTPLERERDRQRRERERRSRQTSRNDSDRSQRPGGEPDPGIDVRV